MNKVYSKTQIANPGLAVSNNEIEESVRRLMEGVPELKGGLTSDADVFEEGMRSVLPNLSQTELLVFCRLNRENQIGFFKKKLQPHASSAIPDESLTVEHKAGIGGDMKTLIVSELAAFYNTTGEGAVWVGVSDQTKRPTGLETQIACLYPKMSRDKFEATVLYNVARTWTGGNLDFVSSLTYNWKLFQDHLVLEIRVKRSNDKGISLVNPKNWAFPKRIGTSMSLLRGYDMVNEINKVQS